MAEWSTGERAAATRESIGNTGANHTYDEEVGWWRSWARWASAWKYTPLEQAIQETAVAYRGLGLGGRCAGSGSGLVGTWRTELWPIGPTPVVSLWLSSASMSGDRSTTLRKTDFMAAGCPLHHSWLRAALHWRRFWRTRRCTLRPTVAVRCRCGRCAIGRRLPPAWTSASTMTKLSLGRTPGGGVGCKGPSTGRMVHPGPSACSRPTGLPESDDLPCQRAKIDRSPTWWPWVVVMRWPSLTRVPFTHVWCTRALERVALETEPSSHFDMTLSSWTVRGSFGCTTTKSAFMPGGRLNHAVGHAEEARHPMGHQVVYDLSTGSNPSCTRCRAWPRRGRACTSGPH